MGQDEFLTAFESFNVAEDRSEEGYKHTWYDKEGSSGALETYKFTPKSAIGDIYISVHSYPFNSIPLVGNCFTGNTQPTVTVTLRTISAVVATDSYSDFFSKPLLLANGAFTSLQDFYLDVTYDWKDSASPDYTVVLYSQQNDLSIILNGGTTNMIHMDGSAPSGFTESNFSLATSYPNDEV